MSASADLAATGPLSFTCAQSVPAPAGTAVESVTAATVPASTFQVPGVPPLGGGTVPDVDGLSSDLGRCDVDPRRLVGTKILCDGKQVTITEADADVVRKIWDGPRDVNGMRLWYGLSTRLWVTGGRRPPRPGRTPSAPPAARCGRRP